MNTTYDQAAAHSVNVIADAFGFTVNEDRAHCAQRLILALWNYSEERDERGELSQGTYGWTISTIHGMLAPDDNGTVDCRQLVAAVQAVMTIRLTLLVELRQERAARVAALRARNTTSA